MSRLLVASSSQWLSLASAIVTALPFTVHARIRCTSTGLSQTIFSIGQSAANNNRFNVTLSNTTPATVAVTTKTGATTGTATSTATVSAGVWADIVAVFASNTDRRVYVDGANMVQDTTSVTLPGSLNQTGIGKTCSNSVTNYGDFDVADVAVWNVALTADEIATLGDGYSSLFVRPASRVEIWPLAGVFSPEPGLVGPNTLTLNNAPAGSDGPRIILPRAA